MGLRRRIGVIIGAQFNDWITRAEDPEKILNQAVEEMEEGLEKARGKIAALKLGIDERGKLIKKTEEQIEYWQERAEDYVRRDMDENTREAVRKRRVLEREKRKLDIDHSEERLKLKESERRYGELEGRVQAAKSRRSLLLMDINLGRGGVLSEQGTAECLRTEGADPFVLFRKMEERVEGDGGLSNSSREMEREAWEREERLIEEEVANLKKDIKQGGSKK